MIHPCSIALAGLLTPVIFASARLPPEPCQTGYRGRVAFYEVMNGSPALGEAILGQKSMQELYSFSVSQGMITLFADGMRKVVEGLTTPEELLRVANTTM